MFVSNFEVNIDSKGRVSVPPSFRSVLGGQSRLILWPDIDGNLCLEGGTEDYLNIAKQTILRSSFGNKKKRALINAYASRAYDLKIDDTGRIKLPEKWIADTGVVDQVLFVGALDKFQIWEPAAYEIYDKEMVELAKEEDTIGLLEGPYQEVIANPQHVTPGIEGR